MMNGKVELLGHYLGLCTNQYSDTNNKVKNNWKKYIEEEKMKNNGLEFSENRTTVCHHPCR